MAIAIPTAPPPSADWLETFRAALIGLTSGLTSWAAHSNGPVNDAEVDVMMERLEAAAVRCANRMHGPQVQHTDTAQDWPSL